MANRVVNGLRNRSINWCAVACHSRTWINRQSKSALAQVQQYTFVGVDAVGNDLHPPRHTMGNFLKNRIGHGLYQWRGVSPRAQHHSFYSPNLQSFAPSTNGPHVIPCQIAQCKQTVKEARAANLTTSVFVEGPP